MGLLKEPPGQTQACTSPSCRGWTTATSEKAKLWMFLWFRLQLEHVREMQPKRNKCFWSLILHMSWFNDTVNHTLALCKHWNWQKKSLRTVVYVFTFTTHKINSLRTFGILCVAITGEMYTNCWSVIDPHFSYSLVICSVYLNCELVRLNFCFQDSETMSIKTVLND